MFFRMFFRMVEFPKWELGDGENCQPVEKCCRHRHPVAFMWRVPQPKAEGKGKICQLRKQTVMSYPAPALNG